MRLTFLAPFLLALLMLGGTPARADSHGPAIQSVIERQISAFQSNDLAGAFAIASPTIQRMFGDPERFGQMVRSGYPMVWRPAGWRMLGIVETEFGPVQIVEFRDGSGRLHEAGYLMQRIDGMWRINGVRIRERPGVGA